MIDFLGYRLGEGAIDLQDENVENVLATPRPKTKKEGWRACQVSNLETSDPHQDKITNTSKPFVTFSRERIFPGREQKLSH
ncbi:hypothetical protein PoB_005554100 [Plakobranchus ocellatus]|uniref:Uncharacterized protein n=1 Tax=Plakobranchus ocellatus TaxID=259542 RepID=A0AAV4C0Y6_9GAST|nr:hypothetical protein PoB_005554100 [Plakobranchus ocellatus]